MNPDKVVRSKLNKLTDLPNIGPAMAADLVLLGIHSPQMLKGCDPYALYEELCQKTGVLQDPCVIDVFISIVRFMNGDAPRVWWAYTEERKLALQRR